jgi:hypothetical protein
MSHSGRGLSSKIPIMSSPAVTETKEDAIIRVASYHRTDYEKQVIHFPEGAHRGVQTSIRAAFSSPSSKPAAGLAPFERLPLEITQQICLDLDIQSCFRFRQVNCRAREAVSSIPAYRAVTELGLDCLAALLRTGIGWVHTLSDIYMILRKEECETCGEYAIYVYLPTLVRACDHCLNNFEISGEPVTLSSFSKHSGISRTKIRRMGVPVIHSLPGLYSICALPRPRRVYMVDRHQALDIIKMSTETELPPGFPLYPALNDVLAIPFMAMVALPSYNPKTRTVYLGVSCKGCALEVEELYDSRTDYLVTQAMFDRHQKIHSRTGFLEHFTTCPKAQVLWAASHQGSVSIEHLGPRFAANGGFSLGRNGWL